MEVVKHHVTLEKLGHLLAGRANSLFLPRSITEQDVLFLQAEGLAALAKVTVSIPSNDGDQVAFVGEVRRVASDAEIVRTSIAPDLIDPIARGNMRFFTPIATGRVKWGDVVIFSDQVIVTVTHVLPDIFETDLFVEGQKSGMVWLDGVSFSVFCRREVVE